MFREASRECYRCRCEPIRTYDVLYINAAHEERVRDEAAMAPPETASAHLRTVVRSAASAMGCSIASSNGHGPTLPPTFLSWSFTVRPLVWGMCPQCGLSGDRLRAVADRDTKELNEWPTISSVN